MKKFLIIILLLFFVSPVFASEWFEIFEKLYIDMSSLEVNPNKNTINFWVKALRKDSKDTFPNREGKEIPYWYSINKWSLDCNNKKTRIEISAIYDLNGKVIYSDEYIPEWNTIIPDTYAEGFYRLFCIIPFEENPLLNGGKQ